MSVNPSIVAFNRRFLSDSEWKFGNSEPANNGYDLITFLAVAQYMELDILQTTWPTRYLAKGGTSSIIMTSVNAQTGLVFKHVSNDIRIVQKEISPADIFRIFINELLVLGHRGLQWHSGISRLQGICWDLRNDEVWPVLVFEKSEFGDLYEFLTSVGRNLGTTERLALCTQISRAIADLHHLGRIL
jgi:serine/threonine protein kinase